MPTYATLTAVGDSITAGTGGVTSYAVGVATNWSSTLDNNGFSGACLQDAGLYYTYGNYATNIGASEALILAFGFNDARYNGADTSITVANYIDLYRSYMRRAVVQYSAANIYIITPWYISDTGLTTGTADFTGRTRAHFETYVDAAVAIAQEFGCNYLDAYSAGLPATTIDDIHPDSTAAAAMTAAMESTVTNPDAPSVAGPTNPVDYTIRVPSGCTCYLVEGVTETLLTVGDHVTSPGPKELMWTDGGGYVNTVMDVSGDSTALNVTPADNVGCTVNSSAPESISLATTTARCHYTYDWTGVSIGEVVFMQIATSASMRILVRENEALALNGGGNNTLFDQTFLGTRIVRATRDTASQYFGFIKNAGNAGDLDVSFFKVGVADQTKLNSIPAAISNFTLQSWAPDALTITGSTSANTYAFDYIGVAIGEPIVLTITTASPIRVIIRESNTSDFLGGSTTTLYDGTIDGVVNLELERTTAEQYFGFRVLNAGEVAITNFLVGASPAIEFSQEASIFGFISPDQSITVLPFEFTQSEASFGFSSPSQSITVLPIEFSQNASNYGFVAPSQTIGEIGLPIELSQSSAVFGFISPNQTIDLLQIEFAQNSAVFSIISPTQTIEVVDGPVEFTQEASIFGFSAPSQSITEIGLPIEFSQLSAEFTIGAPSQSISIGGTVFITDYTVQWHSSTYSINWE